tara:strand:- start:1800 stop:1970 length:171 start_codon:yes stop_codon:yes gene_type:complete
MLRYLGNLYRIISTTYRTMLRYLDNMRGGVQKTLAILEIPRYTTVIKYRLLGKNND